jgi:hypothetical protein
MVHGLYETEEMKNGKHGRENFFDRSPEFQSYQPTSFRFNGSFQWTSQHLF